jgi:hypothetical protein
MLFAAGLETPALRQPDDRCHGDRNAGTWAFLRIFHFSANIL